VLASGSDGDGEFDLSATSITLTIAGADDSGGRTPCNSYGALVTGTADALDIQLGAMTEAACADQYLMELEGRYVQALDAVDRADRGDDTLLLTGESVELLFELAVPVPRSELVGPRWALNTLLMGSGPNGSASSTAADAWIQFTETMLQGHTGCRAFRGEYTVSGEELVVTELSTDEVESCDQITTDQENHLFTVLEGAKVVPGEGILTLTNERAGLGVVFFEDELDKLQD
jgi:heat shock protein HslJ